MNWAIRPPTFKSPSHLAKSVLDDANEMSAFYLSLLAHRNPGVPVLTVASTFAGLAYLGARSASMSIPLARSSAMYAFRRGLMLTVYTAPVTVPYYIGRNVAHAIDPIHGEERFHEAISNPMATMPETTSLMLQNAQRASSYRHESIPGLIWTWW